MNLAKSIVFLFTFLLPVFLSAAKNYERSVAEIEIANVLAEPGDIVEVPVYITGMQGFTTFQLYIDFNSDVLLCNMDGFGVVNIHPVLAPSLQIEIEDNYIHVGRFGFTAIYIPDGAKLFDLRFKYCTLADACAENQYTSALTVQEDNSYFAIFQGGFQMIPVIFVNGSVSTQMFSLSFNISDAASGHIITDAVVNINGEPNAPGIYVFENLLPASYDYLVQKDGYLEASGTVLLDDDTTVIVELVSDSEDEIPADDALEGIIIGNGQSFCYNATNSITTGGDEEENYFVVQDGGEALLIAGNKILMLPGTRVETGAYLQAFIAEDDEYCDVFHNKNIEYSLPANVDPVGAISYQNVSESFFKVYPNPATHDVTIELTGDFAEQQMTVEIYNIMGNKLMQTEVPVRKHNSISLSDYPSGIYLLRLTIGRQSEHTRIIKR